jgi:eukaryotic-like serine/threonine-protein kinase
MIPVPNPTSANTGQLPDAEDARLIRALQEYRAAQDAGRKPDPEDFLARHADIADELRGCLDALAFVAAAAASLQPGAREEPDGAAAAMDLSSAAPLGDFRLLREVGRGGMGIVYEADQMSLGRRVALKVMPFAAALDARQLQRFKNEAQAAAHLHHTNIVPVYAVGCERGVHYYAMQFIEGQTLATVIAELRQGGPGNPAGAALAPTGPYASATATPPAAALSTERSAREPAFFRKAAQLGIQAAEALEHAHQLGVIHRDVKPANLLVDVAGNLWVTDFGLAHCQSQAGLTMTGDLVGTLRYMSPEQVLAQRVVVDHRTDVYSLGVTLYELLTLEPAFPGCDRQELLRQVAFEDPHPVRRLNKAIPAELETIIGKAMEKNPAERYATAKELADDLGRFLRDEPIRARRPTLWQRARRWARRHGPLVWSLVVSSAAVLLLAVVGLAISNAYITREKERKEEALQAAEANLLLARQAVDEMYTQLAGDLSVQPHMQPFQRDVFQKALRFYQEFAKRKSGDPAIRLETAAASFRVGAIQSSLGQRRQAKQACDDAIAALEALAAELPAEPRRRSYLGSAYGLRGGLLAAAGRGEQAAKSYRQALALHGDLVAEHPDVPDYRDNLAAIHQALAQVLADRPREAEKAIREAIRLYAELVAERRDKIGYRGQLIGGYISLGVFLAGVDRSQEAERAFQQALDLIEESGESLSRTGGRWLRPNAEFELGKVLAASGRREAAEKAYRQAIAEQERLAAQFPDLPSCRHTLAKYSARLAAFLTQAGRPDEAAVFRRSARELLEKLAIEFLDEEELLGHLVDAGGCLRDAGELEAAEQFLRKAVILADKLAAEDATEPGNRQRVAQTRGHLGMVLQKRGRLGEAADQFRQGLAICEQLAAEFPDESAHRWFQARALNSLGIALRTQPGEAAAALRCHEQAIALCGKLVADFPEQPRCRTELVRSHFGRGIVLRLTERLAEAVQAFQQALDAYRPLGGTAASAGNQSQFASVHNEWAWLLATCPDTGFRDPGRAVELAKRAVELAPQEWRFWNTLGAAHYRADNWEEAMAALHKSMELHHGGDSFDWFFLAMAHWQRGEKEQARKWYAEAVHWMETNQPNHEELRRFREEAAELLGVTEKQH